MESSWMRKVKMKKISFGIVFVFVLGALFSYSQDKIPEKVVLSSLIEEALEKNLQIKAAEKEWQASLEKITQAKSLPDPMLGYSHFGQSVETRLGPQRNKISLSQKFPFFGKLKLKGSIAQQSALLQQEQLNAMKADIILQVKNAYYSLYWIDRSIEISLEERDVFRRLARIAEKKYVTDQASQQDVLKAQLEITKVTNKLLTLEKARNGIFASLNTLLDRDPGSSFGVTEEFEIPDLEMDQVKLQSLSKEMRPELRKVQHQINREDEKLKLAKKNFYPDFSIMVDYIDIGGGTTNNPEDGRNAWMASVGISIPLWKKKLRAAEAEASMRMKAGEDRYKYLENETNSRINEIVLDIKTALEQLDLYDHSLLPQAEQSLKSSEVGYLAGKVDFLNLLDSERMILGIKNGYFKIKSDLGKSSALLERIVGKDLINQKEQMIKASDPLGDEDADNTDNGKN
jgi:outer membrane protein TolC